MKPASVQRWSSAYIVSPPLGDVVAGDGVPFPDVAGRRIDVSARSKRMGAPSTKRASGGRQGRGEVRVELSDAGQPSRFQPRFGREERLRVRVAGALERNAGGEHLDNAPAEHDCDPRSDVPDNVQVVADED